MTDIVPGTSGPTPDSEPLTFVSIGSAAANPFAPILVIAHGGPTFLTLACDLSKPRAPDSLILVLNVSLKSSGC